MEKYKVWICAFSFLSFIVPNLPVVSNKLLKLNNDPKVEIPSFNTSHFFSDSILLSDGSVVANSLSYRESILSQYTNDFETFLTHSFELRGLYIKMRNQIDYSLFNKLNAKGLIIGKQNYLYEKNYVDSYNGTDFVGRDTIAIKIEKLFKVQKELERNGKLLFVVVAPGKGFYYPEYIPEKYSFKNRNVTNYEVYVNEFQKGGVNFIDFNSYFLKLKDLTKNDPPLFPQTGIHWSEYGCYLALDSILNYVDHKSKFDLVDFDLRSKEMYADLRSCDGDIARGANLFSEPKHLRMCYPEVVFEVDSIKPKPSLLVVGDSFYWQMYNLKIGEKVFKDGEFWYYNRAVYPGSKSDSLLLPSSLNLMEKLQSKDVIMLIVTETNLKENGNGFIDDVYETIIETDVMN